MKELIENSVFIGVMISLASYGLGMWLRKKTGLSFMNPLLISIILVIAFLLLTGVSYQTYAEGANAISFLLTPATICLAVPLYTQFNLLKKNWKAVVAGVVSGSLPRTTIKIWEVSGFKFCAATMLTILKKRRLNSAQIRCKSPGQLRAVTLTRISFSI